MQKTLLVNLTLLMWVLLNTVEDTRRIEVVRLTRCTGHVWSQRHLRADLRP